MMKRNALALLALCCALPIGGCSNEGSERIMDKDVYTYDAEKGTVDKDGTLHLLYRAHSDVPYISLKEGMDYLNKIRTAMLGEDAAISLTQEGDKATYVTPSQARAVFDHTKQTISFEDLTGFLGHAQSYANTLSLFTPDTTSSISLLENRYEKGNAFSVDLNGYPAITIHKRGNDFYLPLTTYNDLLLNPTSMQSFVYDSEKVFLLGADATFTTKDAEGEDVPNELGKAFFIGKNDDPTVSKGYAEYYYQNICLNFDYLYGVRGIRGRDYRTFDDYLTQKGYRDDLLSGNVRKMDAAYAYALSTLRDSHTAVNGFSPLYPFGTAALSRSKFDQESLKEEQEGEALNEARKTSGAGLGYSLDLPNRIAYIAFNQFSSVDEKALKKTSWTEADLQNNATLTAYAYDDIVKNHMGDVDYVAVDLATNNGGSSDGMVYMLGVLVGKFSMEIQNPMDKAHSKSSYAVDINRDGVIDAKDKSLRELGKKIVFIDTHHAFSCGNALPVYAKYNYPEEVTTIGETTGGGTCAVRLAFNALGSSYYISSPLMLSKREDGQLVDIEEGVPADIALEKASTIDRKAVAKALLSK